MRDPYYMTKTRCFRNHEKERLRRFSFHEEGRKPGQEMIIKASWTEKQATLASTTTSPVPFSARGNFRNAAAASRHHIQDTFSLCVLVIQSWLFVLSLFMTSLPGYHRLNKFTRRHETSHSFPLNKLHTFSWYFMTSLPELAPSPCSIGQVAISGTPPPPPGT